MRRIKKSIPVHFGDACLSELLLAVLVGLYYKNLGFDCYLFGCKCLLFSALCFYNFFSQYSNQVVALDVS